jgi:acyl-CoA synthetase (AMP-forming)/AMP-acid ligase II
MENNVVMPTIAEMLEKNARCYPDEVALVELTPSQNIRRQVTWREFDEDANRIANYLIGRGIRKDDKVVHWMRNSINWLEAYFGIIKTGAWVVPLNFRFNAKDFQFCTGIAGAKAVIFEDYFLKIVQEVKPSTVNEYIYLGPKCPEGMTSYEEVLRTASASASNIKLTADDECGLYFTSGTTGEPKPVLLTHRNMSFAAEVEQKHHRQTHEDNFILLPPLYHTGAKMHWFGSLITGAKGTILTEFSPKNVLEAVSKEHGTIVWLLVPWVHDILVALDKGELKLADYNLKSWRLMHIGAQPVPPAIVMHWRDYFPNMSYDNNYGLSESTGPGVVHLGLESEFREGAVGKAGSGWQLKIVDVNDNRDIPDCMVGELCVKGDGMMREYYKNPTLTAKTIVEGWLHTGDMARIDQDGYVYLVDRKKDLIIVGGENIYPIEIESAIHNHPKVYDVAVIGIPDERLVEVIGAVIDVKPGECLTEEEIMAFIDGLLPKYKRPRKVIFDKVPRNPTGKIEKVKLREKYGRLTLT